MENILRRACFGLVLIGSSTFGLACSGSGPDVGESVETVDEALRKQCSVDDAGTVNPAEVYVETLRYHGSGCPRGSVVATVSDDAKSLTLLFNKFVAEAGPNVCRDDSRKTCKVTLGLHAPAGQTVTVTSVQSRGFVQLDEGVTASATSSYRFPGAEPTTATSSFTGPIADNFLREDAITMTTETRCPRRIKAKIRTTLEVDAPRGAAGAIALDTIDSQLRQVFNIELKPCPRCEPRGHGRDRHDRDDRDDDDTNDD